MNKLPKWFFVDLFCGAGGTTSGIHMTRDIAEVVYCINHDKNAIASHNANYPNCIHTTEDIRTAALQPIIELVKKLRKENPGCKICLWASLECTNFTRAKAGLSKNVDSRTLAEHLFRYFEIDFDMIWIENVREFLRWGPIRIKSKLHKNYSELLLRPKTKKEPEDAYWFVPDKRFLSQDYNVWIDNVKSYGYNYDYKVLNAADYGCETFRKRLFIQFTKPDVGISWPSATHDKLQKNGLKKWKSVRPLLNLNETGESIFDKKLSDSSIERICMGVIKFNQKNDSQFMLSEYSTSHTNSLESPNPALTTIPKQKIVTIKFDCIHDGNAINNSLIKKSDNEFIKKLKLYMQQNNISDIKMRGLYIDEMLKIMGFPDKYILLGTKTEKKKYIGNAVPCKQVKQLIEHSYYANVG
jgi:DNA (cytosine-5)-methyltransferase 1